MKMRTELTFYGAVLALGIVGACTSLGVKTDLASDCNLQAAGINQATASIGKLLPSERSAIDGDIALSKAYCTGTLPADQVSAMKVVEAATAHIGAIVGAAALRK